jgi:Protein of unknown function (DUF2795)
LGEVDYPTTRGKLIETARHNHADDAIIGLIGRLPDRLYESPASVSKEIARIHQTCPYVVR